MARKVTWTEVAWNDLEAVAEYISKDSPRYGAAFVRDVRDAARSLSHFSERGRYVPEFVNSQIRELLLGQYRLIYHITAKEVSIIAQKTRRQTFAGIARSSAK